MANKTAPKVDQPAEHFERPKDVVKDERLSEQDKKMHSTLGSKTRDSY